jgi:ribosome maturation factor RimP
MVRPRALKYGAVENRLEELLAPTLDSMGYNIVRISLGVGESKTLQIMAERKSDKGLVVEDCEKISHQVSAILDVEDPIAGAYRLEVSSTGIDRPLVWAEDFKNYIGHEVKITTAMPLNGRKRFRGIINAVSETAEITLKLPDSAEMPVIPIASMESAKLVLTDALIKKVAG